MNVPYPSLKVLYDEAYLELVLDPVTKRKLFSALQRIGKKPIIYENSFPRNNRALLSEN